MGNSMQSLLYGVAVIFFIVALFALCTYIKTKLMYLSKNKRKPHKK